MVVPPVDALVVRPTAVLLRNEGPVDVISNVSAIQLLLSSLHHQHMLNHVDEVGEDFMNREETCLNAVNDALMESIRQGVCVYVHGPLQLCIAE